MDELEAAAASAIAAGSPSVVFLHGTAAHAQWYQHVAPFFAADGFSAVAMSFSGHGDSGKKPRYGRGVWADEVKEVMQHAGLLIPGRPAPIVVGHSLGSFVAEEVAMNWPELISGIVVLDGAIPHPFHWLPDDADDTSPFNSRRPGGLDDAGSGWRPYPASVRPRDRLRLAPPQEIPGYMLNHVAETAVVRAADGSWTWKVDALYNRKMNFMHYVREVGTTETVRALGTRVAVLYGEDSLVVGEVTQQFMKHTLGDNIPCIGIPGAEHHCLLDQPLATIAALRAIVGEWGRSSTSKGNGGLLPRPRTRASYGAGDLASIRARAVNAAEQTKQRINTPKPSSKL